jgi:hypothetical protein
MLAAGWRAGAGDRSSPVVGKAMESGAGKIEPLVLPHAYSHLAPMAGVA